MNMKAMKWRIEKDVSTDKVEAGIDALQQQIKKLEAALAAPPKMRYPEPGDPRRIRVYENKQAGVFSGDEYNVVLISRARTMESTPWAELFTRSIFGGSEHPCVRSYLVIHVDEKPVAIPWSSDGYEVLEEVPYPVEDDE